MMYIIDVKDIISFFLRKNYKFLFRGVCIKSKKLDKTLSKNNYMCEFV